MQHRSYFIWVLSPLDEIFSSTCTKLFFQVFRAQKLVAFLLQYQFLETLTSRGVSRVNYEVPRLSKLHEDSRRCSKDFQQVWYKLELFKVCCDDMPCEVKKNTHTGLPKEKRRKEKKIFQILKKFKEMSTGTSTEIDP